MTDNTFFCFGCGKLRHIDDKRKVRRNVVKCVHCVERREMAMRGVKKK